jgi:hypothetical protein
LFERLCVVFLRCALQISAWSICALASGCMLFMWRKLAAQQRRHLWRLYGFFTSFIFVGCASGILASSFNIPFQQSAVDYP